MYVKDGFFARGSFKIDNGMKIRFWEDVWLRDRPWLNNIHPFKILVMAKMIL
jgi:hypothetical protein